ncbi:MAG TPA: Crp/Fnr family transcriptional regulator [Planctomycetota bacterium]|nr:Crp/Fnr family transcriptional regulator [Planctomycetota bacterium]
MAETLDRIPFFRALSDSERALLDPISRRRTYGAGETVFKEGDPPGPLRILVKGLVSFRQRQYNNEGEATFGTVSAEGELFGISALLGARERYFYTAVCLEPTEVIELDGPKLMRLCEEQPAAGVHIMRRLTQVLAHRLAATREQIRSRVRPGLISHG